MADAVTVESLRRKTERLRSDVSARRRYADVAEVRARSAHASVVEEVERLRRYMDQQEIDAQVARTTRSIDALTDLRDLRRFPKLEVLDPYFLASADQQTLLSRLLEAALDHSSASMGNVQLLDPDRGCLYITAQLGFESPFLDFFRWVDGAGSACAAAANRGATVAVPDVARSLLFNDRSREVVLDAGAAAVQSVPLVGSTGRLLGVFSCHYNRVGQTSEEDVRLVMALVRAAARSLRWHGRQMLGTTPV